MLPVDAEEDLGKAEIEFAASVTAPLFWVLRDHSGERIKNGSVFFLDAGRGFLQSQPITSSRSVSQIASCQLSFRL